MSQDQLSALLAKLKNDSDLLKKINSASSVEAAVAVIKGAGFDVTVAECLKSQAQNFLELSDQDLESVAGGFANGGGNVCLFLSNIGR